MIKTSLLSTLKVKGNFNTYTFDFIDSILQFVKIPAKIKPGIQSTPLYSKALPQAQTSEDAANQ